MATRETRIDHDGGVTTVETETEHSKYGGTVTIYFGSSYTLRVDEYSLEKLRELLYEASKDLADWRSVAQDADSTSDEELEAADEILKSQSDEKTGEKPDEAWSDNDPVNW